MRRALRLILFSLLAGFILNWLVAWACGLLVDSGRPSFEFRLIRGDADATVWVRDRWNITFIQIHDRLVLHSPANAGTNWHTPFLMSSVRESVTAMQTAIDAGETIAASNYREWMLLASGWPLRSIWCLVDHRMKPRGSSALREIAPAVPLGWYDNAAGNFPRFIAFRPVWFGMIANTLFYALLTLMLIFTISALRARHRRTRGLCLACGYDLRGTPGPVCPECGATRPESSPPIATT